MQHRSQYRQDVDGLRGIAVVSVLGFHAFPTLLRGGFIGVDIFFVISGFLISGIIIRGASGGSFSFLDFYGRRIRRIFPALIVVLIACMAYGWLLLLPHDYAQLGKNTAGGAGFVSNFVLLAEAGYFDAASDAKPLLHLWSLGIEEQYYILWPVCLWFGCRRHWRALLICVALSAASFGLNIAEVKVNSAATFYLPQTRFWELLMGAALSASAVRATAVPHGALTSEEPTLWANARSLIGMGCVIVGLLLIKETLEFPGWWAALPTAGTLLMISAGTHAWLNRRILSNRVLVWFGLISYPLYLWHWPLISLAALYYGEFPPRNLRIGIAAASIVLAWITYGLVERPIRLGRNGGRNAIALLSVLAVVGYFGYRTYANEGYPRRFSELIQQIDALQYNNDHEMAWRERSCFLELDQSFSAFSTCDPSQSSSKRPVILIWGDSLAAQLYPGYEAAYGRKFDVVQRTASACAPIFDDDFNSRLRNCNAINDYIIKSIAERRPDRVVLAARWSVHDWRKVGATVSELRNAGVKRIDLVGPVPRWKSSLPRQLILSLQATKAKSIPERMKFGLEPGFEDIEAPLSALAKQENINYLSPLSILCDGDGCITRVNDTADSITSFDYDHLSLAGSVFVVARFPAD